MCECREEQYKFWCPGEKNKHGGVVILVREDLVENGTEVKGKN